jgi:hypothetical protein
MSSPHTGGTLKVSCRDCKWVRVIDPETRLSLSQENKEILFKSVCNREFGGYVESLPPARKREYLSNSRSKIVLDELIDSLKLGLR